MQSSPCINMFPLHDDWKASSKCGGTSHRLIVLQLPDIDNYALPNLTVNGHANTLPEKAPSYRQALEKRQLQRLRRASVSGSKASNMLVS